MSVSVTFSVSPRSPTSYWAFFSPPQPHGSHHFPAKLWNSWFHAIHFKMLFLPFHLLLLLLSRFSRVRLCAAPETAAHQAPPSLGLSRQEHWVAISFSNAWKWKVKGKSLSRVRLLATPWTAACQAPPSMGFSRQDYWSGMPSPSRIFLGKYG